MSKNNKNTYYHRQCIKCKKVKPLNSNNFSSDKSRPHGFMYKCKQCETGRKDNRKGRWRKMSEEQKNICRKKRDTPLTLAKLRLLCCSVADKKRGRDNDLDLEFVIAQLGKPCYYCGYKSVGLDRLDNNLGHLKNNSVPACHECNTAKNDHFTGDEMLIIGKAIRKVKDMRRKSL